MKQVLLLLVFSLSLRKVKNMKVKLNYRAADGQICQVHNFCDHFVIHSAAQTKASAATKPREFREPPCVYSGYDYAQIASMSW